MRHSESKFMQEESIVRSGEVGSLQEGTRVGELRLRKRRSKFVRDSVCEGLPEVRGPQFINFNLNY